MLNTKIHSILKLPKRRFCNNLMSGGRRRNRLFFPLILEKKTVFILKINLIIGISKFFIVVNNKSGVFIQRRHRFFCEIKSFFNTYIYLLIGRWGRANKWYRAGVPQCQCLHRHTNNFLRSLHLGNIV